jgi:hypothetical protein
MNAISVIKQGARIEARMISAFLLVACVTLVGCFGHRTIETMTIEVDNSAGTYKITTDSLNNAFARHIGEQISINHRQAVIMPTGGETLFIKIISDTVTLDQNRFLGDGQKHDVLISYRFRNMSGMLHSELIIRASGFVSRFSGSLSSLVSDSKPKDMWPELDDIIQDLSNQIYFELN